MPDRYWPLDQLFWLTLFASPSTPTQSWNKMFQLGQHSGTDRDTTKQRMFSGHASLSDVPLLGVPSHNMLMKNARELRIICLRTLYCCLRTCDFLASSFCEFVMHIFKRGELLFWRSFLHLPLLRICVQARSCDGCMQTLGIFAFSPCGCGCLGSCDCGFGGLFKPRKVRFPSFTAFAFASLHFSGAFDLRSQTTHSDYSIGCLMDGLLHNSVLQDW
jgi:hypothetical protein